MAVTFDWEVTVTFTLLAVTLFITGLILLLQLKANFPGLHRDYRCYLWAAVIVLSLPLFLRSVTNLCWRFWWEWPADNDFLAALYNDIFSFITDYVPTIGQIGSLVFGFVRNKQIKICKAQAALRSEITVDDEDETHSRTSVSHAGTESYFDPPVESY